MFHVPGFIGGLLANGQRNALRKKEKLFSTFFFSISYDDNDNANVYLCFFSIYMLIIAIFIFILILFHRKGEDQLHTFHSDNFKILKTIIVRNRTKCRLILCRRGRSESWLNCRFSTR